MNEVLKKKFDDAIWAAKSLFDRSRTTGSSANMSFIHEGNIYITGSGTCFGRLTPESFSIVSMDGTILNGIKPSKELPLHKMCYEKSPEIGAVIHTHSFYATLYSCLPHDEADCIPDYTPYLKMKVGRIVLVPFAKPGSQELFDHFGKRIDLADGYLLAHHGSVIPAKTVMDAFYGIEELEESCHIAWELENRR